MLGIEAHSVIEAWSTLTLRSATGHAAAIR
jgi:hypothetical protein